MKAIVGLGNPGKQYDRTRHNIGFVALDAVAARLGTALDRTKFDGAYAEAMHRGEKIRLLKPETYMNLSGGAVAKMAHNAVQDWADLLVIVDDVNLPLGRLRMRSEGSAGGHNGLKSIIEHIGTKDFARLRIGVGDNRQGNNLSDHVLGKFRPEERAAVDDAIDRAVDAVFVYMDEGIDAAMNRCNRRAPADAEGSDTT